MSAPVITVYRNGDSHYRGKRLVINRKYIRNFETFLDTVTRDTRAKVAIRNIFTPNYGSKVVNLEKLTNGSIYVAAGSERFRQLKYGKVEELRTRGNIAKISTRRRFIISSRYRKEALAAPLRNRIIYVSKNGKGKDFPAKLLLDKRILQDLETTLQHISNKMSLNSGAVKNIFTLDGDKIVDVKDIVTRMHYVAVGGGRKFVKGPYCSNHFTANTRRLLPLVERKPPPDKRIVCVKKVGEIEDRINASYKDLYREIEDSAGTRNPLHKHTYSRSRHSIVSVKLVESNGCGESQSRIRSSHCENHKRKGSNHARDSQHNHGSSSKHHYHNGEESNHCSVDVDKNKDGSFVEGCHGAVIGKASSLSIIGTSKEKLSLRNVLDVAKVVRKPTVLSIGTNSSFQIEPDESSRNTPMDESLITAENTSVNEIHDIDITEHCEYSSHKSIGADSPEVDAIKSKKSNKAELNEDAGRSKSLSEDIKMLSSTDSTDCELVETPLPSSNPNLKVETPLPGINPNLKVERPLPSSNLNLKLERPLPSSTPNLKTTSKQSIVSYKATGKQKEIGVEISDDVRTVIEKTIDMTPAAEVEEENM